MSGELGAGGGVVELVVHGVAFNGHLDALALSSVEVLKPGEGNCNATASVADGCTFWIVLSVS